MKSDLIGEQARVPEWVVDHCTYRRWLHSGDFPESGSFAYLDGIRWADLSRERIAHNRLRSEFGRALGDRETKNRTGVLFAGRMVMTNLHARLSTEPENMFVSDDSLSNGLVVLEEGDDSIEVLGSPDMTLEIIGPTSVEKGTVLLKRLYWEAGVKQYWLADSRENHFPFDIFRRGPTKFVATRKNQGWIKSQVFGREFRLSRGATKHGVSKFVLEIR